MSFTLHIDAPRWRLHTQQVWAALRTSSGGVPVPVIKGSGYGLGVALLAHEALRLEADTIAVGTVFEVEVVVDACAADVIVLEPFEPLDAVAARKWWRVSEQMHSGRVIRTVASTDALRALSAGPGSVRVILEVTSSMHRFGMSEAELLAVLHDAEIRSSMRRGRIVVEGMSIHLPMAQPADDIPPRGVLAGSAKAREVMRWAGLWQAETAVWSGYNSPATTVWASHLGDTDASLIASSLDEATLRVRTGTRLWLGDRGAMRASGTVLAVHPLPEGTHVGYRQRVGPKNSTLVVVSGGTAHGIGLSAPSPATTLRQRVRTAGIGALDAAGRALSPFRWQGKQRWFAEPPHQHHSMVWLPPECVLPQIGDQLEAEVRFTTSTFDEVELSTRVGA
jgi:alanine racemase